MVSNIIRVDIRWVFIIFIDCELIVWKFILRNYIGWLCFMLNEFCNCMFWDFGYFLVGIDNLENYF